MATSKAQLESKVESLQALLDAEAAAHATTQRQFKALNIASVELVIEYEAKLAKMKAEYECVINGMRARAALQYRKLTNTSGVASSETSVAARASVAAPNGFAKLEGESNADFIKRIREARAPH